MKGQKKSVYFPTDVYAWLHEEAAKDDRKPNAYLVKLIREEMRRRQVAAGQR